MTKETQSLEEVIDVLKNGGIVLTASDTLLGLLAPFTEKGMMRLNQMKRRPDSKAYITLIPHLSYLSRLIKKKNYSETKLVNKVWPGPVTIIFDKHEQCHSALTGGGDTIAIRYPAFKPLNDILDGVGAPLFSTSVNQHGSPPATDWEDVSSDILKQVDLIYRVAEQSRGIASTIVRVSEDTIHVIRQGSIKI
jgi:L-threonylcarbamoyladenylate synthase